MSTDIKLKRSSVPSKVPTTADIALGEIAINTYDGKIFIKRNVAGTESIIDVRSGAIGGGSDKIFFENDQTITADYTVAATKNAMTAGPVTINGGVTITVETGGRWVIM